MITKPRAKKYRIRRTASLLGAAGNAALQAQPGSPPDTGATAEPAGAGADFDLDTAFAPQGDGFGAEPFATARGDGVPIPDETPAEAAIDEIRREGLTGRQLRMARRTAQKHGLAPVSDFDAVRLLRQRGIDPFQRAAMLELVVADGRPAGGGPAATVGAALARTPDARLPRTLDKPKLPAPQTMTPEARAGEIYRIQRDIAGRRRRRLALLFVRLAVFVLLPTLAAGWYYYRIATPLYATKSEFLIQKADAGTGSLGSLFAGTQFAASQDSITVQSYLGSRDAMLRLDREAGFKAHFSQPLIDPVRRLPEGASNEEAYKLYQKMVQIGFDPTEGIIKMEVIAADPATSARFSELLVHYAEEQVDNLSARLRDDQMIGARDSYEDAERKMREAQARVLELQERLGVLDPTAETGALMSQISGFETELRQKQLELQALLDNPSPNQARVEGARGDIARLQALIAELRAQLTQSVGSSASLARITGELRMAEVDLQTRQTMMAAALGQLETARIEANKQVRYLAVGVRPVAPDRPTYPRRFEDTLLAFLIFSGIYLMISLTASILREQVSS